MFSSFSGVQPPKLVDVRVTFENLCAVFSEERYNDGLDAQGVMHMLGDIYEFITGGKSVRIRLPAPVSNRDDCFKYMWPEGAKVTSIAKTQSNGSRRSSGHRYSESTNRLSSKYTTRNNGRAHSKRSSSVVSSSQYGSRYVGIAEQEPDDSNEYSYKSSATSPHAKSNNTINIGGSIVKPTPSLERIISSTQRMNMNYGNDYNDYNEDEIEYRPAKSKRTNTEAPLRSSSKNHVGFADEE